MDTVNDEINRFAGELILFTEELEDRFGSPKLKEKLNASGEIYKTDEIVDIEKGIYIITDFLGLAGCKKFG